MPIDLLSRIMEEVPEPAPAWKLVLGGLPDLGTAALCWLSWQHPQVLGPAWVKTGCVVVLMEFLVIHSGGFMASFGNLPPTRLGRIGAHLGLAAFYLLFIAAFAFGLDAMWMFGAFGWLFFSKMLVSWTATRGARLAIREQMIDWPFAVAAYLGSLFAGFILLVQYPGGITGQVFLDAGLADAGLFEDRPWVALGAGTLYFAAMGLWRMRLWRWGRPATSAPGVIDPRQ